MASLIIRNLDENVKRALRMRAATQGVSMEEEARRVLGQNLAKQVPAQGIAPDSAYAVKDKMTPEQLMAWVRILPKGKPLDERCVSLDHKNLNDKMWDGEL
jgi:plasmid stability protein